MRDYYKKLTSEKWKLGESPKFTNNFITRFEWGVVDINVDVHKGVIVKSKTFSDALNPDFIEDIDCLLNSLKL